MGKNVNLAALVTVLRELFTKTAVPDPFGLMEDHSSPPEHSKTLQHNGSSNIKRPPPHYPQSNGKAEATVKLMKKIIHTVWYGRFLDGDKLCKALLQYCNTSLSCDGLPLAQKLYGHPVQDTLPAHLK